MARLEFSAKTCDEAEARAGGKCEACGGQLKPGKFAFDHRTPAALGGGNDLANCQVLCVKCHLDKTLTDDLPPIRAADRKAKVKRLLPVAAGMSEIARRYNVK